MTESIQDIANRLYAKSPSKEDILFHYTSLAAMQKIVERRTLRASEVHFFSDAAELRHLVDTIREIVRRRGKRDEDADILKQLLRWMSQRLLRGHMIFAVSFTVQGNLLSQWRAYCPPAKGVSLGFAPKWIAQAARTQHFDIGQCIYDKRQQEDLAGQILESLLMDARVLKNSGALPKKNSYHPIFERVENGLLRIGALFKHPAFKEETEWRAVSQVISDDLDPHIQYREGTSTLVPYLEFRLESADGPVPFDTVWVGPTPHVNQAVDAVSKFFRRQLSHPGERPSVFDSQVPYRTW